MATKTGNKSGEHQTRKLAVRPKWEWIILLCILGYETVGCLLGGILLMAAPDGSLMDMPVSMLHGVFQDFFFPGTFLFELGVLNLMGFIMVYFRAKSDWLVAGLALGGLVVWFVVEISIIRELHWLHAMWGFPVLAGLVLVIPLMALKFNSIQVTKNLLICGILSSLWYVAINIFVPVLYEGYSMVSLTVSELSAIGAPTRIVWVLLCMLYPLLFAAFGWGVLQIARGNRALRMTGILIIGYSIFNFYWPPMHQREVIAAGQGTLTDTLHITWATITVVLMMLLMGFGAAALGKRFRVFTAVIFVVFIIFGILIGVESPGIQANLPTPYIGIWERFNIGAFMFWIMVFAIALIQRENRGFSE
ncbi:DUF998 domain-containing protein [Fluviicola chungangensis]|uniref:DUF998 domain-containing protein n=1 Tax=Fluviicola chungangensis TaxID=2597671 RepID=A0A556N764_9FLAO|nr:DUF998 domain-containing protein [Fluviicola chungangensis]TSJ47968.1 DUF998 domain-containing protein [Fluviicola chungangensis]